MTVRVREFRGAGGDADAPYLFYLQGGPGSGGSRPPRVGGWMKEALGRFRVLMLDQRGTGTSDPVTFETLEAMTPEDGAAYLTHLRAPSIVADAEMIRLALGSPAWTTMGQSFGGFCTLSYLSFFPEGLERSLVTGGLAPVTGHADRVYQATYARMRERQDEFFGRYPSAWQGWVDLVAHLRSRAAAGTPERLSDGSELTVARAQMLGMYLGGNTRVDQLYYLLTESLSTELTGGAEGAPQVRVHENLRSAVEAMVERRSTLLYSVLHEAIYAQPSAPREGGSTATDWSAQRVLADHPDFAPDAEPAPLLTGEHVFATQFDAGTALEGLAETADLLAQQESFGALYDVERLSENTVPVAAAVYTHDVFVDRALSLETATAVRGLRVWESDAYHHDGIGDDGPGIVQRLLALTDSTEPSAQARPNGGERGRRGGCQQPRRGRTGG
ncbi:MAG: alpha/beta fold hydrolase [Micrococcus sp.]|nr:alpha/beta fold hydrolase [Micrococcus sp.]